MKNFIQQKGRALFYTLLAEIMILLNITDAKHVWNVDEIRGMDSDGRVLLNCYEVT